MSARAAATSWCSQRRAGAGHVVTFRNPLFPVGYLETCLSSAEHWLQDWRIVISVSKSTAVLFVKTAISILTARPVQFLGELVQWVETTRYLGVTRDTADLGAHVNQEGKRRHRCWVCLAFSFLDRRGGLFIGNGVLLCIHLVMGYACPIRRSVSRSHARNLSIIAVQVYSRCD